MVNDTKHWKKVMSTIRFIKDLQSFDEQLGNVLNYRLLYHLSYALNVICVFVQRASILQNLASGFFLMVILV